MVKTRFVLDSWVLAAMLIAPAVASGQVTREDYARAEKFLPWNASKLMFKLQVVPNWVQKGDRFWYRNVTRNGKEFVLIDPEHNARGLAFDHERLAAALTRAAGARYAPNRLPFDRFEFVEGEQAIQFEVNKVQWKCNLEKYDCVRSGNALEESWLRSSNGRWVAFVKGDNLFVRPLPNGEEIQLTNDGEPYYNYATSPDSNCEAVTDRVRGRKLPPVAVWSPDSTQLVTHRLDQRQVKDMYLVQSVPPEGFRPVLYPYRFPMVGDAAVPVAKLVVFDVERKTRVWVDSESLLAFWRSPIESHWVWWSEDSKRVYFLRDARGEKSLQMIVAEARTGASRKILEERGATYLEPEREDLVRPNVRDLNGGAEIIWFSERDGWAHLYLYDGNTGALKNQITSGRWVVRDIVRVDQNNRRVYFTAGGREGGRDPYYRHLYRIDLDGSNLQLLTPEDADHEVEFSPTGRFFVDTFSRVDMAPVSVLRSAKGALVRKLEEADLEPLLATGWEWPERFSVKARDGVTDLYGLIIRPPNFDATRKYPVLDDIYPGPFNIHTPKSIRVEDGSWADFSYWHAQAIARLGFVVVIIDGMGTAFRSKAFHDFSYGNMGDAGGLEDHKAGLRQLAARYPYLDLNRVGIYGHSAGGFASARAVLAHPDFYKVGVSSAGNHDQRGYLADWGEKYQGLLAGDSYLNQVNARLAGNLKGKLLLAYGDMDDNVPPALTIQLVDALIKANKDFDLLVLPNRNHGFSRDPYFIRRRWDYFVKYLLGKEPPREYRIAEPPEIP